MTKILLIDNYDSFTYNIVHYLGILDYAVDVIKSDDANSLQKAQQPAYTHILLSPGPGSPADAGLTMEIIRAIYRKKPVLGICLGHQCLGQFFGASIVHAKQVMHGKISTLQHNQSALFKTLPKSFNIVRYHSLVIDPETLPDCLKVIAWSTTQPDNKFEEIMAIQHRDYPLFGIQYHPEALLTEYGLNVLQNFIVTTSVSSNYVFS